MKCPKCGNAESKVTVSPQRFIAEVHSAMGELARRRECRSCGFTWTTIELQKDELQRLRGLACMAMLDAAIDAAMKEQKP